MVDKSKYTAEYIKSEVPHFFRIAREARSIDSLRERLAMMAHQTSFDTFHDPDPNGSTAVIRIRDCAHMLQSILSIRSDHLAGFSVAGAIWDIARGKPRPDLMPAFFADLYHIIMGLEGRGPGISPADKILTASTKTGQAAALDRSRQLDQLWQDSIHKGFKRFTSGLEPESVERREKRRQRIMGVLGGTEADWNDWNWHLKHVLRDPDIIEKVITVSEMERHAIRMARENKVPFGITPYYASLIDDEATNRDRAIRFQVIPPHEYIIGVCQSRNESESQLDFMLEEQTSPINLITRRYPGICILKPVNTCPQICVYCQRNWEIEDAMDPKGLIQMSEVDTAIDWINDHPAINEVLITGGDPMLLSEEKLKHILDRLSDNRAVERIRIGTRTPVTIPMRITVELADLLASYDSPGRRELAIITHFQNAYEVTPQVVEGIARLRKRRISVYNQQVFTFFASRRYETCALRRALRLAGIDPYYSFNMKGKDEMRVYRVPIARILQEQKEEARLLPGMMRTDEAVYNVPGLGKNYLRARQNRNLVSILPTGARVYEFHPWEKNITASVNTYIGPDVPILEYLEALEATGEDVSDYQTIWYYF